MAVSGKMPRKLSGFVICSYLKYSEFIAVIETGMHSSKLGNYVKGVSFLNRRYTIRKGWVPFLSKMVGLDLGADTPPVKLC